MWVYLRDGLAHGRINVIFVYIYIREKTHFYFSNKTELRQQQKKENNVRKQ